MILYQGLLASTASWARVGRGILGALLELGEDVRAVTVRGFRYDPDFPLPSLRQISPAEARARPAPEVGLGFLHPPHLDRLLGRLRVNLFVWEADRIPSAWVRPLTYQTDAIVVPSRFTRDALIASGVPGEQVHVVPFGFPEGLADGPAPMKKDTFEILSVSAPHWRKGVRELFEAYREAFSGRDDTHLTIKTTYDPGRSRRRKPFEIPSWGSLLEECGLTGESSPRVSIDRRSLTDEELPSLYGQAHLYVCPSWGESFGLALLEALASGVPAVATGWSGLLEFLPAGAERLPFRLTEGGDALYEPVPGARVAIPDSRALAERLRWHYENREASRELGAEARRDVRSFSWRRTAERLLETLGMGVER